ncbi:MAG: amidohydrolase family protein [Dehalococcoidia bacterium]
MKIACVTSPVLAVVLALPLDATAQLPLPIIDVHLHSLGADDQGPPPLALCLPTTSFGAASSGSSWGLELLTGYKDPPCADPSWSPVTDDALMEETVAIMERRNIIGVTSGPRRNAWQARVPERIIPGTQLFFNGVNPAPVEFMRARFTEGSVQVFAEVTIQYAGLEPTDPSLEPYFALAEELDVPMGIHVGPGPPGAPYLFTPRYRARLHSPLLYEEILIRHPKLRLYLMHTGWPMLDDLLALMWAHPQVYVDLGMISWALPPQELHRYLRTIVQAGFGDRVMFGSDHMVWPAALDFAIDNIESADYLTETQKRDIFYNNAARFLRLSDEQIARHHGR